MISERCVSSVGLVAMLMCVTAVSDVKAQDIPTAPVEETPLSPQTIQFIRGMTLILLPSTYHDADDWGDRKRIQSGLNVSMDGLKIHTSRRWKRVRHGIWRRVDAKLIDPENYFHLNIALLPQHNDNGPRYRIQASLRLWVTGRQQQWNLGTKLYSISADAVADVRLTADVSFRDSIVDHEESPRLQVLPHIEAAAVHLTKFRLKEISHANGAGVRELGRAIEPVVQRAVRRHGADLAGKINRSIEKKPERFEIPAGILAVFRGPASTPDSLVPVNVE